MSIESTSDYWRNRLRRATGRDPNERDRKASPLDLLFDLSFVVAFSLAADQLAHFLAEGHVAAGVWAFVFIIFAVCWAWTSYTWFASAFDTDDWAHRILTMVQMVGVLILSLGIADVFASIDAGEGLNLRIVAAGYVVMRASMVVMWLRVALQDSENRRTAVLYVVFTAGAQLGWVALAVWQPANLVLLVALVVALWIVELGGPVVSTWDSRASRDDWPGTPWHPQHIAERYGLLVIVTLGEGILGTIAAVAAVVEVVGWSGEAVLIVVAGVGITFGLWWTYFIFPSASVLEVHRNRKWAWSYGHIALFGALAAVGAGMHVAAYAVEGEATIGTVGVVLAVVIPVALFGVLYFALWSVLFRAVDIFHIRLAVGMTVVLAIAVGLSAFGVPLGWCLLVVMCAAAVVPVGYETGGYRHVEADVRREGS